MLTEYVPLLANMTTFETEYSDMIDRIIDTKVRIIVTLDYDCELNFKLFEILSKRGFSPGDFIPIYNGCFGDLDSLEEKYPDSFEDTMLFFVGAVSFA